MLALNARAETIRAVARKGLSGITPEQRKELPQEIVLDDPVYERVLNQSLAVHMAFDPQKLRPVYEAQVCRDETMASHLTEYLGFSSRQGQAGHRALWTRPLRIWFGNCRAGGAAGAGAHPAHSPVQ